MIWNVPDILHELSKLYALRAGDLVFMGTPAGVAALQPGDRFERAPGRHRRTATAASLPRIALALIAAASAPALPRESRRWAC